MTLLIRHRTHYSRLQLLARLVFGMIYIAIPHAIPLMLLAVVSLLAMPVAWLAILITGRYPRPVFVFEVGLMAWQCRVNASLYNLVDGYPAFGLRAADQSVVLSMLYPEQVNRMRLLLQLLLGWAYCGIPHGAVLLLKAMVMAPTMALAVLAVLVTGRYPEPLHSFCASTLAHALRVRLYMGGMTDRYPSFT